MNFTPYLNFDHGECRAAMSFYHSVLGGELSPFMTFGETPAASGVPADMHDRVMHSCLTVGGQSLMGSDTTPACPYEGVKGMHVALTLKGVAQAEKIFAALSQGARKVDMPLQETFWAARFGSFTDRFGTPWLINADKE
jgi:PhnB protein